jgi:hypothetical protein
VFEQHAAELHAEESTELMAEEGKAKQHGEPVRADRAPRSALAPGIAAGPLPPRRRKREQRHDQKHDRGEDHERVRQP